MTTPPPNGRRATEDRTVRGWLHHEQCKIRVCVVPPDSEQSKYLSPEPYSIGHVPVGLFIVDKSSRPFTIDLTAMTEEELDCLLSILTHAIEGARPVVRELDNLAVEAFAGDYDEIPQRALRGRPAMFKREVITDQDWAIRPVPVETT